MVTCSWFVKLQPETGSIMAVTAKSVVAGVKVPISYAPISGVAVLRSAPVISSVTAGTTGKPRLFKVGSVGKKLPVAAAVNNGSIETLMESSPLPVR